VETKETSGAEIASLESRRTGSPWMNSLAMTAGEQPRKPRNPRHPREFAVY
jgi:hypothetical protein